MTEVSFKGSLRSRGGGELLPEEAAGIHRPALYAHLVVQVRARAAARASREADDLALLHAVAGLHEKLGHVAVDGADVVPVVERDAVPVVASVSRREHEPARRR